MISLAFASLGRLIENLFVAQLFVGRWDVHLHVHPRMEFVAGVFLHTQSRYGFLLGLACLYCSCNLGLEVFKIFDVILDRGNARRLAMSGYNDRVVR